MAAEKALKVGDEDLYGHSLAEEMVNPESGEIYAEAGDEITEKVLKALTGTPLESSMV